MKTFKPPFQNGSSADAWVPSDDCYEADIRAEALELIRRVEVQLKELKDGLAAEAASDTPSTQPSEEPRSLVALRLRRVLKARRARHKVFGQNLFADPAWDILLEAYASHLLEERNSVTAMCMAAGVPPTTALRWVNKLEEDGLLVRKGDPLDARRSWVELSPVGVEAMRRYLDSVAIGGAF